VVSGKHLGKSAGPGRSPPGRGVDDDEDRLPRNPGSWLTLMISAALVGVLAGLLGGTFRLALRGVEALRESYVTSGSHGAWNAVLTVMSCSAAAALAAWLPQRFAPSSAGSGIPHVEAVLRNRVLPPGLPIIPVKFLGGVLGIGAGLALGREGPTVQMGATVGRLVGDRLAGEQRFRLVPEPWTLIAAGAGAGLATAFDAPLAGVIFVLEELLRRFSARVLGATVAASVCATAVARVMAGPRPELAVASFSDVPLTALPGFMLLGLAAGLLAMAYNAGTLRALKLFDGLPPKFRPLASAAVGAVAGVLAISWPTALGGGEPIAVQAVAFPLGLTTGGLIALTLLRWPLCMFSYATGSPGGVFAPMLSLGALLGLATVRLAHVWGVQHAGASAVVVVSITAFFTGAVRSPLTGVVLLLEMTGAFPLLLPMLAGSGAAYVLTEFLRSPPLYDLLRSRDERLERTRARATVPVSGPIATEAS
jgi:CIC family chloride channel protein